MDKELLLKPRLAEGEVELTGVGTVRFRVLTRDEVMHIREAHLDDDHPSGYDLLGLDNAMLAAAMVDPVLTEEEVEQWAAGSPAGEVTKVANAVQRLSGLTEEATKSDIPGNRQQRRAAVRNGSSRKTQ